MGADGTGTAGMGQERSLAPRSVGGLQAPVSVTLATSKGTVKDTHVVAPLKNLPHPGATSPSMFLPLESDEVGVWYKDCAASKSQANSSSHAGGAAAKPLGLRTC